MKATELQPSSPRALSGSLRRPTKTGISNTSAEEDVGGRFSLFICLSLLVYLICLGLLIVFVFFFLFVWSSLSVSVYFRFDLCLPVSFCFICQNFLFVSLIHESGFKGISICMQPRNYFFLYSFTVNNFVIG